MRDAAAAALRIPLLGCAAMTGGVIAFGHVAQRYTSEFIPLLALGAIDRLRRHRPAAVAGRRRRQTRRARPPSVRWPSSASPPTRRSGCVSARQAWRGERLERPRRRAARGRRRHRPRRRRPCSLRRRAPRTRRRRRARRRRRLRRLLRRHGGASRVVDPRRAPRPTRSASTSPTPECAPARRA